MLQQVVYLKPSTASVTMHMRGPADQVLLNTITMTLKLVNNLSSPPQLMTATPQYR
jgi:hypothetical protein